MNAALLLKHYERVADAPDAVARLRRFVLDLAVRGKLVQQDPKDEFASEMLGEAGIKDFAIFAERPGWASAKVGRLMAFQYGKGLPESERLENGPIPVFGSNGVIGSTHSALTKRPAIIVGRKGSAGALNLCDGPSWTTDVAYFVEAPSFFLIRYLMLALSALGLDQLGKGVKPGLSRSDANALDLFVPPIAEQRRILAKVDELMSLCDQLELAQTERDRQRERLTLSTLAKLNKPDPGSFAVDARFALDHLEPLTNRTDQIKQLRQTISNLAVRGKLVEQDPTEDRSNHAFLRSDETAEAFDLAAFTAQKAQFQLPPGWIIEPLSRVSGRIVDCPHTTPKWTDGGVLCIRTNQVRAGKLDLTSPYFVSEETYKVRIERLEPECDDILYIREGGVLGVGCRIPPSTRLCLGQRLMLIRANRTVDPKFLELAINSPWITEYAAKMTTGGAAPRVNMSIVRAYPIPVPPLAEQRRIAAKVDELMKLCDQLEISLSEGEKTRSKLLETVLGEALEAA